MPRRLLILALSAVLFSTGAAVGAFGGASQRPAAPTGARAEAVSTATVVEPETEALPPLPESRPKLVEPVAGEVPPARDGVLVEQDDGSDGTDKAPTRAASTKRLAGRAPSSTGDAVSDATALPGGVALPPLEAPEEVLRIIEAGNSIAKTPYKWGGGHGRWQDTGYDCFRLGLLRAGLRGAAPRAARLRPADGMGQAGQGQMGDGLRERRSRLHGRRGHPLRHLGRSGHRLALAERDAHRLGLRRAPPAGAVGRRRHGWGPHPMGFNRVGPDTQGKSS